MTAIINYGVGNLFSLRSSFAAISEEAVVTGDRDVLASADRVVLPGVGAFSDAAAKLREAGLFSYLRELAEGGKPLLGICLGMQLLFHHSMEYGRHEGLALIPGEVLPLEGRIPAELDIPHMGWNSLRFVKKSPLFDGIEEGAYVYFVHSYAASSCGEALVADAEYGLRITAAVQEGNVFGTQFHPEKSGDTGLRILKNFCGISNKAC